MAEMKGCIEMLVKTGQIHNYRPSEYHRRRFKGGYARNSVFSGRTWPAYATLCVLAAVAGALVWL